MTNREAYRLSPWLTPNDVAAELGFTPRKVREMCERGELRAVLSGRWRIHPNALEEATYHAGRGARTGRHNAPGGRTPPGGGHDARRAPGVPVCPEGPGQGPAAKAGGDPAPRARGVPRARVGAVDPDARGLPPVMDRGAA